MNRIAPVRDATSGQARINAKRTARAAFWTEERRTILIRVSVELEPYFREQIHILGQRARIDGSTQIQNWCALDLHVHIPGAPANAVRADPILKSIWHGDHCEPTLDSIQWTGADGRTIPDQPGPTTPASLTAIRVTPSMGPCATGRHEWHPGDERNCDDIDHRGR